MQLGVSSAGDSICTSETLVVIKAGESSESRGSQGRARSQVTSGNAVHTRLEAVCCGAQGFRLGYRWPSLNRGSLAMKSMLDKFPALSVSFFPSESNGDDTITLVIAQT